MRPAVALCLACAAWVSAAAAAPAFPERLTRKVGEFTIQYSPGDEAFADALAVLLPVARAGLDDPGDKLPITLQDLLQRREYFMGKVTKYLALAKPTKEMTALADWFEGPEIKKFQDRARLKLRRFALWRRTELTARLSAGEPIPGFRSGAVGNLTFDFNMSFGADSGEAVGAPIDDVYWPITIATDATKSDLATVSEGLGRLADMRVSVISTLGDLVFVYLHEMVESGIVWSYIGSPDRRWFCAGMANFIAWRILADEAGIESSKLYYDLDSELADYAPEATSIDLAGWRALEAKTGPDISENLYTANHAFATKVIANIVAKHGLGILPKLFTEIGKTSVDDASMVTVSAAFRSLTGESLVNYLPKPEAAGK